MLFRITAGPADVAHRRRESDCSCMDVRHAATGDGHRPRADGIVVGMVLQPGRWTAELDGDFVVFLIGAMVHDPAVASEAADLLMTMADMLDELESDPSQGLLGYTRHGDPGH